MQEFMFLKNITLIITFCQVSLTFNIFFKVVILYNEFYGGGGEIGSQCCHSFFLKNKIIILNICNEIKDKNKK